MLSRKIASYCFRFASLMSAGSNVIVVLHAPVFLPISSMVFRRERNRRVHESAGLAEHEHLARLLRLGRRRGRERRQHRLHVRGHPASAAVPQARAPGRIRRPPERRWRQRRIQAGQRAPPASARRPWRCPNAVNHLSNVAFISSRVTTPSLLASTSGEDSRAGVAAPAATATTLRGLPCGRLGRLLSRHPTHAARQSSSPCIQPRSAACGGRLTS